jgi:predicted nuclease of predicted toxin-antitoxin system
MKLLLDQNLSFKLCQNLADLFPESNHVRLLGLSETGDRALWDYARAHGFTIVSQDADFAEMAALLRTPPKVVWLQVEIGRQQRFRRCFGIEIYERT